MNPPTPERPPLVVQVAQEEDWRLPKALLEAGVRAVMAREEVGEGEVSLPFLGDPSMRSLNLEYLREDRPTDVIAFALHEPGDPPREAIEGPSISQTRKWHWYGR